jgi:hypothetical protein
MERQGEVENSTIITHGNLTAASKEQWTLCCPPADANVENLSVAKTPRGSLSLLYKNPTFT